jgi:hypothetical protein
MAAPADQILIVLVSALVGYGGKWAWDWRTARRAEKKEDQALWSLHNQQFHLPLLDAGQQLQARLCELSDIYNEKPSKHTPASLSGDFRELYLLSRDELLPDPLRPDELPSILDSDANQPRRDDAAVQRLRKRMCYELTFATTALYRTARYLAYARLAHLHLSGGGSTLESDDRKGLDQLIAAVGAALQGPGGAGIFSEQQESIAEMMSTPAGRSSPTMTSGGGSWSCRVGSSSPPCSSSTSQRTTSSTSHSTTTSTRGLGVPASPPRCATRSAPPPRRWRG